MYWGKQKLTKSVSMNELLRMREEGMTNKQIAEALDTSEATVYNYIGGRRKNKKRVNKYIDVTKQDMV